MNNFTTLDKIFANYWGIQIPNEFRHSVTEFLMNIDFEIIEYYLTYSCETTQTSEEACLYFCKCCRNYIKKKEEITGISQIFPN